MRFGKTLQNAIYPPWRDHYIEYSKLKRLLREGDDDSDAEQDTNTARSKQLKSEEERGWTEHDESVFVEELVNVQLEKVHTFQQEMSKTLKERMESCEARLEKIVAQAGEPGKKQDKGKAKDNGESEEAEKKPEESQEETKHILKETLKELDDITFHINQLQKFSRINFTGFLKAAKKHDRRSRATDGKGKKRDNESGPRVRPLLQVRLSALEFNKEVYSPLLYRLSAMYAFVRQHLEEDHGDNPSITTGQNVKKYTSHKFWVHPDNYLEVKTYIVRRLPVLVYNPTHTKELDVIKGDPTITSLYFDNEKFSLYTDKVEKKPGAASLRLRWYGQLVSKPDISLERKTMQSSTSATDAQNADTNSSAADGSEDAIEERVSLKEKYVEDFIRGEFSVEKSVAKMRARQDKNDEDVEKYEATVHSLQDFIKENNLQPMLRAVYNRSAFQIPGDDGIRVSLDTNMAFIREDALDPERPCRDPDFWHRTDIDDAKMEFPFSGIRKGEIHRFPYALLEIKVRDDLPQRSAKWIYELMGSHLLQEAPRFSKFVHGVATLYEDYVNIFPFWLGEMDKDIRKDPESAWQIEQVRRARQAEDDYHVGSLKIGSAFGQLGAGRFGSVPRAGAGTTPPSHGKPIAAIEEHDEDEENQDDENTALLESGAWDRFDTNVDPVTKSSLLGLFPGFSTSRYGQKHRKRISEQDDADFPLPPGVTKPEKLIMHSTPVNVEPKVWLANQRTFIKWEHVSILLATLSLGLYNAAGEHNYIARALGIAYTVIALFTGIWGYWVYIERCNLITNRSGKDFDKKLGPIVVSLGLVVALVLNFGFKVILLSCGSAGFGTPKGGGWEWCLWKVEGDEVVVLDGADVVMMTALS
ncbi:VTC domain-containing protein [Peziza echinospora]|nr:VTC domain-containing protein [Peziza echinospora]